MQPVPTRAIRLAIVAVVILFAVVLAGAGATAQTRAATSSDATSSDATSSDATSSDATSSEAGDLPLPVPRVYDTATVRARPLDSATATVTVLDRQTIEASGTVRTEELLAFVPGVTVVDGATRGGLSNAQIRGGDPSFTRVLVDGVPMEDATYQVGSVFDLEAMPVVGVERIEVVRGPLSHHYGSTGLAGAIHLVTRRGKDAPAVSARVEAGEADLLRSSLTLAGGDDDLDGFLSLASDEESGRIADESFDMVHLQGRTQIRTGERSDLRLSGRAADWSADDYPDASGGPVSGSGELRSAEHEEAALGLRWNLQPDASRSLRFEAVAYRHEMERQSPAVFPLVPPSVESTRFTRTRVGGSGSFALGSSDAIGTGASGGLRLGVGADVETEDGVNDSLLLLPPFLGGAVAGDYDLSRTRAGAYAELVGFRDSLTWELSARVDEPEDGGRQFSPRLGLVWRPDGASSEHSTRIRLSAGRAYQEPSFFALASPRALGGNPELDSETALGVDLGFERQIFPSGFEYGVTLFSNRYEDLVDFDFGSFLHVNRSRVDAHGVESHAQWRPTSDLWWRAQATWQDVENVDTGAPLRHRPEWSGALLLSWRATAGLQLVGDLRFQSSSVDEQIPVPDRTRVDGYRLLGLGATWRSVAGWTLGLRMDNVTDESYETLIGFPGAGRSARISVGWSARP